MVQQVGAELINMRQRIANETKRIQAIRMVCDGKHTEIEGRSGCNLCDGFFTDKPVEESIVAGDYPACNFQPTQSRHRVRVQTSQFILDLQRRIFGEADRG